MGISYRQRMLEQLKDRVIAKPVVVSPKVIEPVKEPVIVVEPVKTETPKAVKPKAKAKK